MSLIALLAVPAVVAQLDSTPAVATRPTPLAEPQPAAVAPTPRASADTTPTRRRSVELSDGYYTRLAVHRWGTYAMVPLFGAQAVLGEQIYQQRRERNDGRRREIDGGLRTAHSAVAVGIDALFVSNTVTGVWNLVEARAVPERKTLRVVHSVLMLAADAGFAASSSMGWSHRTHRTVAYASLGVSAASAAMMLLYK